MVLLRSADLGSWPNARQEQWLLCGGIRMRCDNRRPRNPWVWAIAGLLVSQSVASAQMMPPGQSAADNASIGAVRSRAPGNMVSAGVARAFELHDVARGGIDITETSRPISIRAQALAEAITTVFDQLNQALALLQSLILARAGEPSDLSADLLSGLASTASADDTDSTDRAGAK